MDGGCQLVSHGNVRTATLGSPLLDALVAFGNPQEIGPVVTNRPALDLDGLVVFLEGIVDEVGVLQTPQSFEYSSIQLPHEILGDRLRNFGALRKAVLGSCIGIRFRRAAYGFFWNG